MSGIHSAFVLHDANGQSAAIAQKAESRRTTSDGRRRRNIIAARRRCAAPAMGDPDPTIPVGLIVRTGWRSISASWTAASPTMIRQIEDVIRDSDPPSTSPTRHDRAASLSSCDGSRKWRRDYISRERIEADIEERRRRHLGFTTWSRTKPSTALYLNLMCMRPRVFPAPGVPSFRSASSFGTLPSASRKVGKPDGRVSAPLCERR